MEADRDPSASTSDARKRPYKVWDHRRYNKKGLVAGSLAELLTRGREKLEYDGVGRVSAVLETDGTTVDDAEYFSTLPDNTVFLLLRDSDRWVPPGVDVLRAALTCIPRIVCQTMQALDLQDEAPSWKIADNRGQVSVQLHWDASRAPPGAERRPHLVVRGVGETPSEPPHDAPPPVPPHGAPPPPYPARLSRQGSSIESVPGAPLPHVHTAECGGGAPLPHHTHHVSRGSTADKTCDFHCCALHRSGGTGAGAITKSAATSPIQEVAGARRPLPAHVRFDEAYREAAAAAAAAAESRGGGAVVAGGAAGGLRRTAGESSESEDAEEEEDNTEAAEEGTSTKLLLLVDQLSVERTRYLSIKDIGVILERLSSKILDVERMERQRDGDDCRTWTLKATIRGDVLREIGVVYHGHYHSISEHPRYARRPQPPPPPPAVSSSSQQQQQQQQASSQPPAAAEPPASQ